MLLDLIAQISIVCVDAKDLLLPLAPSVLDSKIDISECLVNFFANFLVNDASVGVPTSYSASAINLTGRKRDRCAMYLGQRDG